MTRWVCFVGGTLATLISVAAGMGAARLLYGTSWHEAMAAASAAAGMMAICFAVRARMQEMSVQRQLRRENEHARRTAEQAADRQLKRMTGNGR